MNDCGIFFGSDTCSVRLNFLSLHKRIRLVDRGERDQHIFFLADTIATFHSHIEKTGEGPPYGSPDIVLQAINECLDEMPAYFLSQISQEYVTAINTWLQAEWRKVSGIILQRKRAGFVRECHGDLHLGNITIFEGRVCVFDALEFEPRLRWIDVMSKVAF